MATDLDKLEKEVDIKKLESQLQNLAFASLEGDELARMGDQYVGKMFRLSQMSIEYLIYTQSYLEQLTK